MQQDNNQKTVIVATLAFVVGFALAWLIVVNKDSDTANPSGVDDQVNQEEIVSLGNFITVADQAAGVNVAIEKIGFTESGWVVIHESDNEQPGRILGAQLFDAGNAANGNVDLLRGTLPSQSYYAVLRKDNGDRAFDPKKDEQITTDEGSVVLTTFKTFPDAGSEE
ncbi:MAG: hypothetical protein A2664_03515 [Candidatus Taylorbacteria bacterium RIFCSPHIGHO2_01_FULL_46_22b]|uniref:DUF7282 domain-containing protein n=1 Tax=Candidatus Taylorbacteria bacterium RIFCSPHIGHO2_01_FULL_46_22b TaxID=1802301 RepID=A0A1G2M193_9BACT|nr:MAG: hypothetical protein A2664_03515 [Candidatus Taylorbacteria bacterium RIFCSPHIGHO2_01_FULL_46_22b]